MNLVLAIWVRDNKRHEQLNLVRDLFKSGFKLLRQVDVEDGGTKPTVMARV
jgi:hypothetical protein